VALPMPPPCAPGELCDVGLDSSWFFETNRRLPPPPFILLNSALELPSSRALQILLDTSSSALITLVFE
jgi:hypothetical protein